MIGIKPKACYEKIGLGKSTSWAEKRGLRSS